MKTTPPRALLLSALLVLGLLAGVAMPLPTLAFAQDDAGRFAAALAAREESFSDVGPMAGELVQNEVTVSSAAAGVSLADFSASAAFDNPTGAGTAPWDFGFTFHQSGGASQRIYVDSEGSWFFVSYPDGLQDSGLTDAVDASPGGANVLDLIVVGDEALFGVNGEFVSSLALPPAITSDIQVGTGYVGRTTEPDRVIAVRDFSVWPAPPTDAADEESTSIIRVTVTPEVSTTPEPGVDETSPLSDSDAFNVLIDSQVAATTLAGPFTANLKEETSRITQSWAGVDLADFHATALFDVPQMASDVPWEIGYTFRNSPAGPPRLTIDSLGNWYFSIGDQGPIQTGTLTGLETSVGAANRLDLLVAQEGAVFGVNGVFAAAVDLPTDSTSGDVAVSTGVFSDQTLADRVTHFSDFAILDFNPDAAPPETEAAILSEADIADFASYVDDTRAVAPQSGPFAGRLVETALGTVPQAPSGAIVADFGAVATFTNPDDVDVSLWDGGIQFRTLGDSVHRVVVRSNNEIYLDLPDGSTTFIGIAAGYDPAPGARNEFQLFVDADRALFGVNDELAAVVSLPDAPIASDVLVGTAFFSEDFVQGRMTGYEGFSVWQMA